MTSMASTSTPSAMQQTTVSGDDAESVYLSPFSSPPLKQFQSAKANRSAGPPRSRNPSRNCSPSSSQQVSASKDFNEGIPTEWEGWSLYYSDEGYAYYYHHDSQDWHWAPCDADDIDGDCYQQQNGQSEEISVGIAANDGATLSTDLLNSFSQTLNESQNYSDMTCSSNESTATAAQVTTNSMTNSTCCGKNKDALSKNVSDNDTTHVADKENVTNTTPSSVVAKPPRSSKPPLSPVRTTESNHHLIKSMKKLKPTLDIGAVPSPSGAMITSSKAHHQANNSSTLSSLTPSKCDKKSKVIKKSTPPTVKQTTTSPGFLAFKQYLQSDGKTEASGANVGVCSGLHNISSARDQLSQLDMSKVVGNDSLLLNSVSTVVATGGTSGALTNESMESTATCTVNENSVIFHVKGTDSFNVDATEANGSTDGLFQQLQLSSESLSEPSSNVSSLSDVSVAETSVKPTVVESRANADLAVNSPSCVNTTAIISTPMLMAVSSTVTPLNASTTNSNTVIHDDLSHTCAVSSAAVTEEDMQSFLEADFPGVESSPVISSLLQLPTIVSSESADDNNFSPTAVTAANTAACPMSQTLIKYTNDDIDDSLLIHDSERSSPVSGTPIKDETSDEIEKTGTCDMTIVEPEEISTNNMSGQGEEAINTSPENTDSTKETSPNPSSAVTVTSLGSILPTLAFRWYSILSNAFSVYKAQHSITTQNLLIFSGLLGVVTSSAIVYMNMQYKKSK